MLRRKVLHQLPQREVGLLRLRPAAACCRDASSHNLAQLVQGQVRRKCLGAVKPLWCRGQPSTSVLTLCGEVRLRAYARYITARDHDRRLQRCAPLSQTLNPPGGAAAEAAGCGCGAAAGAAPKAACGGAAPPAGAAPCIAFSAALSCVRTRSSSRRSCTPHHAISAPAEHACFECGGMRKVTRQMFRPRAFKPASQPQEVQPRREQMPYSYVPNR